MNNKTCIGAGLISLDILIRDDETRPISYYVGGTCGNVLMILSYMGWSSYPIARLDNTKHTKRLLDDMYKHNVNVQYISTNDGNTPVIIQRNIIDKYGIPTHKFEFKDNKGRFFLNFRSLTKKQAQDVLEKIDFTPKFFFFDRISPAIIDMARFFKSKGSIVYFEPSCKITEKGFNACLDLCDIIKFSEQRITDVVMFENLNKTLVIQTLGNNGLRFRKDSEWIALPSIYNNEIIDTSGAGDWTTAAFINYIFAEGETSIINMSLEIIAFLLNKAQKIGSLSCSFEGARGMMQLSIQELNKKLGENLD